MLFASFSERQGTPFNRLRTAAEIVVLALKLLSRGCPIQAIVFAFGVDERTVMDWQARGGAQCQAVHEHLVEQPRELGEVQLVKKFEPTNSPADSAPKADAGSASHRVRT
ncbi:MAG: hypothetical protein ACREBD_11275 [Blastocatellia bacterium]